MKTGTNGWSQVHKLVRTANRFELKYLLAHHVVSAFVSALGEYTEEDPHNNGGQGYPVFSIYWDSPEFALFWEKIEGIKYRRKLRFRRYPDGEGAYVEIKQRTDRTLQKRRVRWPLERVFETFGADGATSWTGPAVEHPVASEALFLCHQYRLRPVMGIRYRRRAFFGTYEPDLRITLDARVQYHARDLDLSRPFETGKYLVDPRLIILEIKFTERVPAWLCKLVSRFRLQVVRLSKYCTAVDREYYGGRLT